MEEDRLLAYQRKIRELEEEIAYYQRENARLTSQNEILHETAWNLVAELREIKKTRKTGENGKKD